MNIHLIEICDKSPDWAKSGFLNYSKRIPKNIKFHLKEVRPGKRSKNVDLKKILFEEGQRMISMIPKGSLIIKLEIKGQKWTTKDLSLNLQNWMNNSKDIVFLVGGPEGLPPECKEISPISWSLSTLTLPHAIVKIFIAEQIYRAWSILQNHPYHRE